MSEGNDAAEDQRAREDAMVSEAQGDRTLVRHFRQIVLWPLQVVPIRKEIQIQDHWEVLARESSNPWSEVRDEFSCEPEDFKERHYSEFVTFLPYVRRFLYGEARSRSGVGSESPMRVFRRADVAQVRITYPGREEPSTFDVAHVDLCFFYDIDVIILVVEIYAQDLPLDRAMDTMYRFGRAYPTYWHENGGGGHCVECAEWLSRDGPVLAVSDYENRDAYLHFVGRFRAPRFASHWDFLLRPLVADQSDAKGLIRYRQVEYSRMPLLVYLAMNDARALTRADFVRLGLVTGPGPSDALPYSERFVIDFEARFCYDQYWNESRSGLPGTRFMSCGHAFVMVGDA